MMGNEAYLDVAHRIAATLCRDAIHDGDRCNWLGDAMEPAGGQLRSVHRSFRGDLYSGTAGIAWFLAQVDRFRPDPLLRSTARAAIEHALHDGETTPAPRIGFYSGESGIGYAAAHIGEWIDDRALLDRGVDLMKRSAELRDDSPADVMSGAAGIIGPLLALHARHGQQWMLDRAVAVGDRVVAHVASELTGYAHGAAGKALALLELHRITSEHRFLDAAQTALEWERSWFSPQHQNWPDFRKGATDTAPGYALGWCHGAPGIGLSRLRAWRLSPRAEFHEEAASAIRGTYAPLATLAPNAMFALCHGAAGNAELFLEAGDVFNEPGYTAIAEAIGRIGIERYHEPRRAWPSGLTAGGHTPGLMLGLTGIGYFYLRLHDRASVPSLLVIGPPLQ